MSRASGCFASGLGKGPGAPGRPPGPGAHQRGLTQQAAAPAQAAQHHVEIGTAAAPAGDLGEGVGGEQVLGPQQAGGSEPAKAQEA